MPKYILTIHVEEEIEAANEEEVLPKWENNLGGNMDIGTYIAEHTIIKKL